MKSFLSPDELTIQLQTTDFVLSTQRQIVKDFGTSGLLFKESFSVDEHSYSEIMGEIQGQLNEILKLGEAQLLQLLYQIDIPQHEFLSLVQDPDFIQKMSDLILRREAYKVHLRSKF